MLDPVTLVTLVVAGAVLVALYVGARRATTIAELLIERGELHVARGGLAPAVLADLRDVARTPPIHRARIRITRASGRAELEVEGTVAPAQLQRIRNVVGSVPLARLVNARQRVR